MTTKNKKIKELQEKFIIPEEFTAKVNTWKGKYKKIKYLDAGGSVVFFRMPTRQEMAAAENLSIDGAGTMDSYKKAEKIMVDCYLGGQLTLDEILADIEAYMAVAEFCLYNLVERKKMNWGNC